MSDRRGFVRQMALLMGGLSMHSALEAAIDSNLKNASNATNKMSLDDSVRDEDFWHWIRESYSMNTQIINLNNGGVAPSPKVTQDALDKYNRMCADAPSYFMWQILDQGREPLRENLAFLAGCSPEEIAINRNSTEGLNTVIFGLNLKAGDEVILTKQDYPNMINAWKQREKRDGIKLVWLDFELPTENDDMIVDRFEKAITDKTKIVHITHIINWCGQIMPARKISDMAHKHGLEVIIDAAHSFALLDYKIPDLGGDYLATSLHKWMCAPLGSGMLYIKKDKIPNVWALLSSTVPDGPDIRKFESLGTRSFPSEMAIGYSLDFHNLITTARKQARLQFLKNYWVEKVINMPRVKINTSLKPEYGCAIGSFAIEGKPVGETNTELFTKYKIHSVGIVFEKDNPQGIKAPAGVRITPNVYTTLHELDKLVMAIENMTKKA